MLSYQKPFISGRERARLDRLIGMALVDKDVHRRLIDVRDPALLKEFGLSMDLQSMLLQAPAQSLSALAEAVYEHLYGDA